MSIEAFAAPGQFWRGNLHTHSNLSDGALAPGEVCRLYGDAGYDFLCLSDHFMARYEFPIADTRAFRSNRFTTILGAELHAPANSHGETWHMLAVGLPEDFAPTGETESGVALSLRARDAGAFVGASAMVFALDGRRSRHARRRPCHRDLQQLLRCRMRAAGRHLSPRRLAE
jgi:predicted metal-dependent phosphoesterase TrpH